MYTLTQVKYIHSNAERKIMNCYRNLQQICTLVSSTSPSLFSPSVFSESESKPPTLSRCSSKESSSNYDKYMRLKIKEQLEISEIYVNKHAHVCPWSGIIQIQDFSLEMMTVGFPFFTNGRNIYVKSSIESSFGKIVIKTVSYSPPNVFLSDLPDQLSPGSFQ